ncbi:MULTISPECIES: sigma 54-interacting transcriptional regulator [unclassified Lactobacillus]|uniref:sigma 54-interacting transcriptional regulator n=1 Tax=unclassified Lactobacillus TaxID=2620435 RepID=UPI00226AB926|nr:MULTISPECIES: sigma 54-interacting transcriptional regulator [unclassified Lactobacillus]MCX8720478.1 sigma 54-interacting transcriptional regulator [Lactobacillus sp. B4010]MCX8731499.1 sigma 54-interacting transcriptional regulator [Lactobacillus sp. B4015]MCX8733720.1 sigma 54-interacting transcriptional regulator [Lactobacillus sp. B4012]
MLKNDVLAYLKKQTKTLDLDHLDKRFTAGGIAQALNAKRNTVSLYLNQLTNEHKLVKVQTRPVRFIHRAQFEKSNYALKKDTYLTVAQLEQENNNQDILKSFAQINPSLKESVERVRAAVLYPNNGLPLLITGESGTGKSYLVGLINRFCRTNKLIKTTAPFVTVNCAQYADNPELLTSNLFGYKKGAFTGADQDHDGAFVEANGGILFLDEVHRLGPKGQEKLFTYLDQGLVYPVGETSHGKRVSVRLCFATTEEVENNFLTTFMRRIPVKISLPPLSQRSREERLNLIYTLLCNEQREIAKPITVSDQVLEMLANYLPVGNIGDLKNAVKLTIARANADEKKANKLTLTAYNLPVDVLMRSKTESYLSAKKTLQITDETEPADLIARSFPEKKIFLHSLERLLTTYEQSNNHLPNCESKLKQIVYQLFDTLLFEKNASKQLPLLSYVIEHLKHLFEQLQNAYQLQVSGNAIYAISYYLFERQKIQWNIDEVRQKNALHSLYQEVRQRYPEVYAYVGKLLLLIKNNLEIELNEVDYIFLSIYLNKLEIITKTGLIKAIVLAHGYATAGSIANVVNRLLNAHTLDAFDMPINVSTQQIANKIIDYSENNDVSHGLIILVDMGSLQEIEKLFPRQLDAPLLLINNVSTSLALIVGESILQKRSFREIGQLAQQKSKIEIKLTYPAKRRQQVILTTCYSGIGTATHVARLLERCMPSSSKIKIIPYDYQALKDPHKVKVVNKMYDVIGIVGTENPEIPGLDFIHLEKILSDKGTAKLQKWLTKSFTVPEIKLIMNNLVKNFSLERTINMVTILDAPKVIENITIFLQELERRFSISLSNQKKFTLYVHISYLIERLIRKEKNDLDPEYAKTYAHKYATDLKIIKAAFSVIIDNYNVKIPVSELIYIDQIIFNYQ